MQNNMSRNGYGNVQPGLSSQPMAPNQMYHQLQGPNIHQEHTTVAIDNLADQLANINFRNAALQGQGKPTSAPYPMHEPTMNSLLGQQSAGPMLVQLQDGTFVPGQYQQYANQYNMALAQAQQYQQAAYHGAPPAGIPHTPRNNPWMPTQGIQQLPDLVAPRRSSWSSNEEPSPKTPFNGYQSTVLISSHSPTTWNTTPSPIQSQFPYNQQIAKDSDGVPVYADFWAWTQQEPSIPPPVPAVHSGPDGGRGSLDKILDNRNGTTNVYIRGLQPNTTDEMLEHYGRRFGPIVSQKAIVEMSNPNLCKGYGFILYHNYNDAENCIRAFFFLGYEAKFAKDSHNQRLKALGEPDNTNLYVSNLPRTMVEAASPVLPHDALLLIRFQGLVALFQEVFPQDVYPEHKPTSTKILKDGNGISRGVGFARFENPEVCQQIIDAFNNKDIGEGKTATTLQIRYADTTKQKELKKYTAEKRQFKTNEYNEAVYGPDSPWRRYSPLSTSTSSYSPIQIRAPGSAVPWSTQTQASSISPPYAGYPQSYAPPVLGYGQAHNGVLPIATIKPNPDATSGPARLTTCIKIESPSVTAAAKKAAAETIVDELPEEETSSASDEDTLVCRSKSSKSCGTDVILSPTKSKL
ncbi:hypothetical protein P7C71_g584, partial [Lecanoromycetidae sp. Uapishka_2]